MKVGLCGEDYSRFLRVLASSGKTARTRVGGQARRFDVDDDDGAAEGGIAGRTN